MARRKEHHGLGARGIHHESRVGAHACSPCERAEVEAGRVRPLPAGLLRQVHVHVRGVRDRHPIEPDEALVAERDELDRPHSVVDRVDELELSRRDDPRDRLRRRRGGRCGRGRGSGGARRRADRRKGLVRIRTDEERRPQVPSEHRRGREADRGGTDPIRMTGKERRHGRPIVRGAS